MVLLKITALSSNGELGLERVLNSKGYKLAFAKKVCDVPLVVEILFSRSLSKGVVALRSPDLVRVAGHNIMRAVDCEEFDYSLDVVMDG